jgi:hypothetical protein
MAAFRFRAVGVCPYPRLSRIPSIEERPRRATPVTRAAEIRIVGILLGTIRGTMGRTNHGLQIVLLAVGAITPLLVFGLLAPVFLPIVLLAIFFVLTLWNGYRPAAPISEAASAAVPGRCA